MIWSDRRIRELAKAGGIEPFEPEMVRKIEGRPVISYGLGSYGYDIRLSPKEFKIFRHVPGTVVDPKNFNPDNLESVPLQSDENGDFFVLPANSYGLGVAIERLGVPSDTTVLCLGKSTYARTGLIANVTPAEACMADDTEVLTDSGWANLKDVASGDFVLTLNPATGLSEYQPVLAKQEYYYNGDLLHFKSRFVDQLVTPQHRMWVGKMRRDRVPAGGSRTATRGKREVSFHWDYALASDVYGRWGYYLSRDVRWEGVEPEPRVRIGKYDIEIETWCKFLGAWMGDGSAFDAGNGNYVIKLAVVTKDEKRRYFRSLLDDMGVNHHESQYGFSFQDKALCQWLQPFKGAKNKHLPIEVKQYPPALLLCLIEGLMKSDGNMETKTFGSASKRLADDFQEICLKAGYNATHWTRVEQSKPIGGSSTHYKCRYSTANASPNKILPRSHAKVPYAGMVYDITVPNGVFLSRRNGRASFTGNSWRGNLTLEFSNSSPADCRIYAGEGVVQMLFLEGEPCEVSYEDRDGKYQDQTEEITLPRT